MLNYSSKRRQSLCDGFYLGEELLGGDFDACLRFLRKGGFHEFSQITFAKFVIFLLKVSLKTISNNWQISTKDSNAVLMKWLDQNRSKVKKTEVVSEFLVQGTNTKGVYSLAFVTEDKKKILEKKWSDFKGLLYSIEIKSNSRKLDLPDYEPIKV